MAYTYNHNHTHIHALQVNEEPDSENKEEEQEPISGDVMDYAIEEDSEDSEEYDEWLSSQTGEVGDRRPPPHPWRPRHTTVEVEMNPLTAPKMLRALKEKHRVEHEFILRGHEECDSFRMAHRACNRRCKLGHRGRHCN